MSADGLDDVQPDGGDVPPEGATPAPVERPRRDPVDRKRLIAFFCAVCAVFMLTTGGHTYSIDEELMFQGTRSLVNFSPSVAKDFPNDELYRLRSDGSYATVYGIGQSLVGVPMYVVGRVVSVFADGSGRDFTLRTSTFMTNAILTALIALMIVLTSRELGASDRNSFLLGAAYAFGTFAFAHARTNGSEPGSALLLLVGCFLAIRFARTHRHRTAALAGLAVGASALFRISGLAMVPLVGLYVLWACRQRLSAAIRAGVWYSAGVFASLAVLGLFNRWRYGSFLDVGYGDISNVDDYPAVKGLVNLYFSEGKGFFLFAPVCAVIAVALVVGRRPRWPELVLFGSLIAANSVIVARLAVWSGDLTWGPRYLQVTLPLFVCLGAVAVEAARWRRAVRVATVVGLLGPALLGVTLYFAVFFVRANDALGAAPVASEDSQPVFLIKVRHDPAWNQMLGNLELLPAALRDTLDARRPTDPVRYTYVNDPTTHYGYFSAAPRIDFWWLWVGPTRTSDLTYLLFVPIAALGATAGWAHLSARRQRPDQVPDGIDR